MYIHVYTLYKHVYTLYIHVYTLYMHVYTLYIHVYTLYMHVYTLYKHVCTYIHCTNRVFKKVRLTQNKDVSIVSFVLEASVSMKNIVLISTYLFSIDDCTNLIMYFGIGGEILSTEKEAFEDFKRFPFKL